MTKKTFSKIHKHTLNILVGLSVFVALSLIYDFFMMDRNLIRYITLAFVVLIILGALFLRIININGVKKIFTGQMGVNS